MTASRTPLAAVPDAVKRDGAYVRVSAVMGRAGEDFLSPTVQADTIAAASARTGGRVVEVWEDLDVTGRTMTRPGLERALDAARSGRIDRLFVYDLSRWARNAADGLAELAAIERLGVEVVSATESIDRKTASGRLTAGVLLLLAEHYSDLVGERWKGVIAANLERGVWHGRPPLGYVRTAKREIAPDPVMGPAVADAFRRYADGASLASVARDLGRVRGTAVLPSNLRLALASTAYLGEVRVGGKTAPGRHPALVDDATFDRVQRRLAETAGTPPRTLDAQHALAGLVRCDGCGWTAWFRRRSGRELAPFYVCRRRRLEPTSDCPGFGTPPVPAVEAVVLEAIRRELVDVDDTSAAEAARLAGQERARVDLLLVQDEAGRLERSLGTLAEKLAEGVLSDTAYRLATVRLEERLAVLRDRAREAAAVAVDAPSFTAARDLATALVELWPVMTPAERNAAVRTHVREVRIRRASFRGEPVADRVAVVLR